MHPSIHSLIRPSSRPSFSLRFSAAGGILTINLLERLHQLLLGILSRLHGDGDDGKGSLDAQQQRVNVVADSWKQFGSEDIIP